MQGDDPIAYSIAGDEVVALYTRRSRRLWIQASADPRVSVKRSLKPRTLAKVLMVKLQCMRAYRSLSIVYGLSHEISLLDEILE